MTEEIIFAGGIVETREHYQKVVKETPNGVELPRLNPIVYICCLTRIKIHNIEKTKIELTTFRIKLSPASILASIKK